MIIEIVPEKVQSPPKRRGIHHHGDTLSRMLLVSDSAEIHIGSVQLSLLGGKIFVYDVQYLDKSVCVRIVSSVSYTSPFETY